MLLKLLLLLPKLLTFFLIAACVADASYVADCAAEATAVAACVADVIVELLHVLLTLVMLLTVLLKQQLLLPALPSVLPMKMLQADIVSIRLLILYFY